MKYRVLLVGGEQCDGQMSETLLTSREIACAWCRNTTQAADVFERDHAVIDMVLVSVRVTGEMSSDELIRWMRDEGYRRPIIALTEDVATDNLRIAAHIRAGANMHSDRSWLTVAGMEGLLSDAVRETPELIPPFRVVRERVTWRERVTLWLFDVFILRWVKGIKLVPQTAVKQSTGQKVSPDTVQEPAVVQ